MTEVGEKKDASAAPVTAPWLGFQEQMFKNWQDLFKQGVEQWQKNFGAGTVAFAGPEFWKNWNETFFKQFNQVLGQGADGLGPEVFAKLMNAGAIYSTVMEFWQSAWNTMLSVSQGKPDAEAMKQIGEKWIEQYQEVMRGLWGPAPSEDRKQIIDAWGAMLKAQVDMFFKLVGPIIGSLGELPEKLQAAAKGDQQGMLDLYGILRKDYEQTMGKLLKMPAMGYFKELQERIYHIIDSYIEFQAVLDEFYSMFYETGMASMQKIMGHLSEFKEQDWSNPEGMKKFYRMWLQMNEDSFHELFLSPQFINLLHDVLSHGLQFRKWTEELYDKVVEATPLPSKSDMDEVYKSVYELKKEVRRLRKELDSVKGVGPSAEK
jgi:polyhydroxyalkanoate synthase subunit PhaE